MHPLLAHQLEWLGLDADSAALPDPRWAGLLAQVARAYADFDRERGLLARSQQRAGV